MLQHPLALLSHSSRGIALALFKPAASERRQGCRQARAKPNGKQRSASDPVTLSDRKGLIQHLLGRFAAATAIGRKPPNYLQRPSEDIGFGDGPSSCKDSRRNREEPIQDKDRSTSSATRVSTHTAVESPKARELSSSPGEGNHTSYHCHGTRFRRRLQTPKSDVPVSVASYISNYQDILLPKAGPLKTTRDSFATGRDAEPVRVSSDSESYLVSPLSFVTGGDIPLRDRMAHHEHSSPIYQLVALKDALEEDPRLLKVVSNLLGDRFHRHPLYVHAFPNEAKRRKVLRWYMEKKVKAVVDWAFVVVRENDLESEVMESQSDELWEREGHELSWRDLYDQPSRRAKGQSSRGRYEASPVSNQQPNRGRRPATGTTERDDTNMDKSDEKRGPEGFSGMRRSSSPASVFKFAFTGKLPAPTSPKVPAKQPEPPQRPRSSNLTDPQIISPQGNDFRSFRTDLTLSDDSTDSYLANMPRIYRASSSASTLYETELLFHILFVPSLMHLSRTKKLSRSLWRVKMPLIMGPVGFWRFKRLNRSLHRARAKVLASKLKSKTPYFALSLLTIDSDLPVTVAKHILRDKLSTVVDSARQRCTVTTVEKDEVRFWRELGFKLVGKKKVYPDEGRGIWVYVLVRPKRIPFLEELRMKASRAA